MNYDNSDYREQSWHGDEDSIRNEREWIKRQREIEEEDYGVQEWKDSRED